jgi:predicted kinase
VSKCRTTAIDPISGNISHPGHSKVGSIDARIALWDVGAPFNVREAVCRLISVHQVPMFAFGQTSNAYSPEFVIRKLSHQVDLSLLVMLAEADIRGRICDDQQKVLDDIALFGELAIDEKCYSSPRLFADNHTRVSYFRGAGVHPDYKLFQELGSKVTVMCGLPASGKDTWVATNRKGQPVVSFDDARMELGLKHGKNEGAVAHRAFDKAKELLRNKESFVWCATHLSEQMRAKTLDLLYRYNAEVEIVYLEQSRLELLRRNTKRDSSLTNKALLGMLWKWEIPLPTEAHQVTYAV